MAGRTRKQNKPYDDAFKLLAEGDAEALLLLLGEIKLGEPVEITPLHSELRISTKLPDQAYKVVTASGARIVHIEAQSSYDHLMPERMADYGARMDEVSLAGDLLCVVADRPPIAAQPEYDRAH